MLEIITGEASKYYKNKIQRQNNKDRIHPKISPLLSLSGTQQKQVLLCRNSTSSRVRASQTIFLVVLCVLCVCVLTGLQTGQCDQIMRWCSYSLVQVLLQSQTMSLYKTLFYPPPSPPVSTIFCISVFFPGTNSHRSPIFHPSTPLQSLFIPSSP